jgi:hypothetical protein
LHDAAAHSARNSGSRLSPTPGSAPRCRDVGRQAISKRTAAEDPLPEIAGQEQPVSTPWSGDCQEAQLGDTEILRPIDDDGIERPFAPPAMWVG